MEVLAAAEHGVLSIETMKYKTIDEFLSEAKNIEWFSAIGNQISNHDVERIESWDDWEGPEDSNVESLHVGHSEILDNIVEDDDFLKNLFNKIVDEIIQVASKYAPYDADEDPWYAPTTAVGQAAWTVALISIHLKKSIDVPAMLIEQWNWFKIGHWPCSFSNTGSSDKPNGYCVF